MTTSTSTNNSNNNKIHGDDIIGNNKLVHDTNGPDENENDDENENENDDERRPLVAMNINGNSNSNNNCSGEGEEEEEKQQHESTTITTSSSSSNISSRNNNNNNNSSSSPFSSFPLLARRAATTTTTKSNLSSSTSTSTTTSNMTFFASATTATTAVGGFTLGSIREERIGTSNTGGDDDIEDEDEYNFINPDPIMNVMDYLEDEIDEHTYDEIIPLQLRMALEDTVFGWDHFLSSLLGHVGYTCGSYLVTFWVITFVVLHEVPWGSSSGSSSGGGNDSMIQHKHSHPWGMPYELFSILRIRFRTVVTDA